MSWEAQAWVWEQQLPSTEKWVLMGLANYTSQDFTCWPSLSRLAVKLGLTKTAVIHNMEKLLDRKLIKKEARKNPDGGATSNLYRLHLVEQWLIDRRDPQSIKNTTQSIKNTTQSIKNTTQSIKNTRVVNKKNKGVVNKIDSNLISFESTKETSLHAQFVKWWCDTYQQRYKVKYHFTGKDADHVKQLLLLALGDMDQLKQKATQLLESTDPFYEKTGRTIPMLLNQWNKLAAQIAQDNDEPDYWKIISRREKPDATNN